MKNIFSVPKRMLMTLGADITAFDRHNTNEEQVLCAHFFFCYKGVAVFRIPGKRSGAFGAIFLTRKNADADTVRHEYGHILQMRRLGPIRYAICIFLPSWKQWGTDKYYDKPWEITADLFGGARADGRDPVKVKNGYDYLESRSKMSLRACIKANREIKKGKTH